MLQTYDEVALGGLNTLLNRAVACKGAQLALPDAQPKPQCLLKCGLKPVLSNSSVSTMAPEDWDCEGDTCEDDVMWTPECCPQPRQESQPQPNRQVTTESSLVQDFQHCFVPKTLNLAEEFGRSDASRPPTTLMIRNIPNRYTQRELIKELEGLGFSGAFDFLYAPIDFGTMGNVGYAFVNFIHSASASQCQQVVDGYTFKKHQQKTRTKVAKVSVAHLQGLQANIRHYENSAVTGRARSKRCGPVIMTSIANALALA